MSMQQTLTDDLPKVLSKTNSSHEARTVQKSLIRFTSGIIT